MPDFSEELKNTVSNRSKGDIADAIGMPDEQDYQNLLTIIKTFERKNPGVLKYTVEESRKDFAAGRYGNAKHSLVNKDSGQRLALEIPEGLYFAIQEIFPSMFRSKKHLRWFTRKFPGLTISGTAL